MALTLQQGGKRKRDYFVVLSETESVCGCNTRWRKIARKRSVRDTETEKANEKRDAHA